MSALAPIRSLRISQGMFTAVNLGLASYLVHQVGDVASSVTVALAAACVSVIGIYCASGSSEITSTKAFNFSFAFAVDWIVGFVNMIAVIALGIFVTTSPLCQEKTCTIAKVHTVLTAFNFSNWAATATYIGIQISKQGNKGSVRLPETGKIQI